MLTCDVDMQHGDKGMTSSGTARLLRISAVVANHVVKRCALYVNVVVTVSVLPDEELLKRICIVYTNYVELLSGLNWTKTNGSGILRSTGSIL